MKPVFALVCLAVAGCGSSGSAAPDAGGVGVECARAIGACEPGLVCRDGVCRERVVEDAFSAELPPVLSFDVPDVTEPEVADVADTADVALDDTPDADVTVDVEVVIEMIGEHTAADAPSETRLTLGLEQAAVQELDVPEGAWKATAMEVIALEADGACGRFAARLWVPDALGVFGTSVAFASQEVLLPSFPAPRRIAFTDGPALSAGKVRAGIAFLGPCDGAGFSSWIALDDSGAVDGSFVFAGNWIPGSLLGLPGRWAIRLEISAGLP